MRRMIVEDLNLLIKCKSRDGKKTYKSRDGEKNL